MSGQTLNDRLTAARHTLAGQGLARIVCKATTEEVIGPKKKHLDNLLHCTNEPNVSIPQLANLLIERTQHSSWVVVFKALITVHHLMCYGNDRFTQYLASSNCTFQLGSFVDKCGVQGYDMSTFIRRYAKYLNEKAIAYRTVAFDFCKCKRGKEDGILRTMNVEKLLKTLPILQNQLDALLEFDCSSNDLTNGVVNSCFMLLFRDLIRLFACYNDGIINLLEKYFDMNKKHCRDALDIYKKFLIRMDRVAEFLKVAEVAWHVNPAIHSKIAVPDLDFSQYQALSVTLAPTHAYRSRSHPKNVGIDKGEIPDLTKLRETCRSVPQFESNHAPSSLLEALEQHLAALEGRKGSSGSAVTAATRATNLKNAVSALSHTSNAFGSADENASVPQEVNGVKVDESVRKAVEEEAEVMNQLKFDNDSPLLWEQPAWEDSERRMKEMAASEGLSPPSASSKTNPFLASPAEPAISQSNQGILDLFSSTTSPTSGLEDATAVTNAKNDLLSLNNNPFADSLFSGQDDAKPQQDQAFPAFAMNGFANNTAADAFATDESFAAAFGDTSAANEAVTEMPASPAAASETAASPTATSTAATAAAPSTVKLNLPVLEPFGGRSTSPSPTTDLMRGAGTTPILANPPDSLFEAAESAEEATTTSAAKEDTSNLIWGSDTTDKTPTMRTSETDPFGAPFEPESSNASQPPTAVVPPLQTSSANDSSGKTDLFGLDSSDFGDFGEPPSSAQPCAPPPSPFGGLDLTSMATPSTDLRTQAMANAGGIPPGGVFPQQKTAAQGIDNLNFALQKAMQMPAPVSPTFSVAPAPVLSAAPGMASVGFPGPTFSPMGASLPPGSTPPASLSQLDNFGSGIAGTPSVRASSTPGYGTPPSGLSSPAKSVTSVGATSTGGGFDAFGDTLQPQTSSAKATSAERSSGSLLKGDLDSTLASLASNLDMNGPKQTLKKSGGHQWGSPKPVTKTAAAPPSGWAGAPAGITPTSGVAAPVGMGWSASPQHGFQAPVAPAAGQWGGGVPGAFPQQPAPNVLPQQPYMVGGMRPVAPAPMTGMQMPMGMPAQPVIPQQPMYGGFTAQMSAAPAAVPPASAAVPSQAAPINDPFGAL